MMNEARHAERRDARAYEYLNESEGQERAWVTPELALETELLETFVDRAIAALPPVCRRVYLMIREDDASYRDISKALGIITNTVRYHVAEAHACLRAALAAFRDEAPVRRLPSTPDVIPRSNDSAA